MACHLLLFTFCQVVNFPILENLQEELDQDNVTYVTHQMTQKITALDLNHTHSGNRKQHILLCYYS